MDDVMGKIGAILSDPESLQQLQELAQMLQQENASDVADDASDKTSENTHAETNTESTDGFDFNMLLKIQELMGAMHNSDEDTELLLALRPHLKEQRQKKVDQAVKLLKLYAIFSAVKENGLLQDLL